MTRVLVGTLHGDLLGLLADFAIEQLVRRQSGDGRAHLDIHKVWLLCREAQMLLNRSPSWRQRRLPQSMNKAQDFDETGSLGMTAYGY